MTGSMPSWKRASRSLLERAGLWKPISEARGHYRRVRTRREAMDLYRQFIAPGDLCFDLGANVGDVSEAMLALGARVVALEPQSESVQALQMRFAGNASFRVIPKAVAAKTGTAKLLVCESSDCSSLSAEFVEAVSRSGRLNLDLCRWNEERDIETTTLDNLVQEFGVPAFVKIDVEGLEDEVLRGCSRRLPCLSFEFTPERLAPALACIEMLNNLGPVEFNYTIEGRKQLQRPSWASGDELATKLAVTKFRVELVPPGDVYARFM